MATHRGGIDFGVNNTMNFGTKTNRCNSSMLTLYYIFQVKWSEVPWEKKKLESWVSTGICLHQTFPLIKAMLRLCDF